MAVRFDASGEAYSRTISYGSQSQFTVCCWVKASASISLRTVWQVENGDASDFVRLAGTFDGTALTVVANESVGPVGSLTFGADTWYFVGISINGAAGRRVSKPVGGSFTSSTWVSGTGSVNMVTLRIGVSDSGSAWWNGSVAGFKIWTAALSQAEMEAEAEQFAPVRSTNLRAYYRFATPSTTDDSGNGQTLSGGSGASTDTDPPFATPISVADSGASAEALTVTAAVPLAQPGSAVEALAAAGAIVLADTGAQAEALTATVTAGLADAGAVAEAIDAGVPIPLDDTAAGADALAAQVTPALAEAGAVTEALAADGVADLIDVGAGADGLVGGLLLLLDLDDAGAAAEAMDVVISRDLGAVGPPRTRWPVGVPRQAWAVSPPRTRYQVGPPRRT